MFADFWVHSTLPFQGTMAKDYASIPRGDGVPSVKSSRALVLAAVGMLCAPNPPSLRHRWRLSPGLSPISPPHRRSAVGGRGSRKGVLFSRTDEKCGSRCAVAAVLALVNVQQLEEMRVKMVQVSETQALAELSRSDKMLAQASTGKSPSASALKRAAAMLEQVGSSPVACPSLIQPRGLPLPASPAKIETNCGPESCRSHRDLIQGYLAHNKLLPPSTLQ